MCNCWVTYCTQTSYIISTYETKKYSNQRPINFRQTEDPMGVYMVFHNAKKIYISFTVEKPCNISLLIVIVTIEQMTLRHSFNIEKPCKISPF
jgi:hypothetical protein